MAIAYIRTVVQKTVLGHEIHSNPLLLVKAKKHIHKHGTRAGALLMGSDAIALWLGGFFPAEVIHIFHLCGITGAAIAGFAACFE